MYVTRLYFFIGLYFYVYNHGNFSKKQLEIFLFLGLISGLLFLVRPTNIIFIIAFLLYKIENFSSIKKRLYWFIQHYKELIIATITAILIGSVQFFYWKWATGNWFLIPM